MPSRSKRLWLARMIGLLALTVGAFHPGAAQDTRNEFWPELDVYWRQDAVTRLYFLIAPTVNRQESYGECLYGAHVDISMMPILERRFGATYDIERFRFLQFRFGVRYGTNYEWSTSDYTEWRGILELTGRYLLPLDILAALRGRAELRWLNGDYSTRYRMRFGIERETEILPSLTLVPFGTIELFYDTRFNVWNRIQMKLGVGAPIVGPLVADIGYAYQHDIRRRPAYVHALSLAVLLYFE